MDSTPPYPIGPGQRVLAAIVFTDVVSFSARMQTEEVATLGLLERDFALMRKACEKYSGTVLKTTGDGLLLYFTSAVQAVTCAQKMQRDFAQHAKEEPADALKHRIGIHLGEVFVKDQDVMGDGVNIAARIQAQAEPGGIVISQTVYDVVKNKLKLDVVKLGVQPLKNISEAVTMYRVLLEPPKPAAASPVTAPMATPLAPVSPTMSGAQKLLIAVGLVIGLGIVAWLLLQARDRHEADLAKNAATRAELDKLASGDQPAKGTAPAANSGGAALDFIALALKKETPRDEVAARRAAEEQMQPLLAWINPALARYTSERPLLVPRMGTTVPDEMTVFTGPDGRIFFAEGGAIRGRAWSDLRRGMFGAIIVSALSNSPIPPPPEVVRGAEAYAYFHRLPDMAEALQKTAPKSP